MKTTKEFFRWLFSDLPLQHNIVIVAPKQIFQNGEPVTIHMQRNASTPEEASRITDAFCKEGRDVFYGIGMYLDNLEPVKNKQTGEVVIDPRTGTPKLSVKRTKKHCKFLPTLIADIDCGDNKPYKTLEEGVEAVMTTMLDIGFTSKEFTLIRSGGGVHMYLKFEDILVTESWVKLATKLKNLLLSKGLQIDVSKTTDEALILRPVGTFNYKKAQPRPVEVIHMGEVVEFSKLDSILDGFNNDLISSYQVQTPVANSIFANIPDNLPDTDINFLSLGSTGYQPLGTEIKCAQLLALEQDCNVPEPLWYQALGVAAYTANPKESAVLWSRQYDRYNEQQTLHKMAQYIQSTTGPALCSTFDNLNGGICTKCKYHNIIKTPVQAVLEVGERTIKVDTPTTKEGTTDFTLPGDYRITPKGEIIKIIEGMEIVVSDYLIFLQSVARLEDPRNPQAILNFMVKLPSGVKYLELNASAFAGAKGEASYQSKFFQLGVAMSPKKMKLLGDYVIDCYRYHQDNKNDIPMLSAMGWSEDRTKFVWGNHEIGVGKTATEVIASNPTMKALSKEYQAHGNLDDWKKVMEVLASPTLEHLAFATLLGFASPLYNFTNLEGVTVNFYSEYAGTGKTSACRIAQSIYGRPSGLTMEKISTPASIAARLGTIKNLPAFMDEVSDSDGSRISEILYSVATGKEKGRSDINGELKDIRTWSLVFMMTSNKSLHEKLDDFNASSQGQKARLIEVLANPNPLVEQYGEWIDRTITENYGVAAPVYLSYLVEASNNGTLAHNLRELMTNFESSFNFKFSGSERFIRAAVIMSYAAGVIAQRVGLLPSTFEVKRVIEKVLDIVRENRQTALNSTPTIDNIIGDFLVEKNRYIIQNFNFPDSPSSDPYCFVPDEPKARMDVSFKVTGRKGLEDVIVPISAILTIPVKIFKDYCRVNRMPFTAIEKHLQSMKDYNRSVVGFFSNLPATQTASGMPISSVSVDCYKFVLSLQQLDSMRASKPDVFAMNDKIVYN